MTRVGAPPMTDAPDEMPQASPPADPATADELTPKEARFCEEYLVDLNATRTAHRAGYSRKTARQIGYELLRRPRVQARIAALMAERSRRTQVTVDRVLEEIAVIGFSDLRDYAVTDAGKMTTTFGAPPGASRAVRAIKRRRKVTEEGAEITTVEFQLWDKDANLRLLAQHLGIAVQRHEHTGANGGPIAHEHVGLTAEQRAERLAAILTAARARAGGEEGP